MSLHPQRLRVYFTGQAELQRFLDSIEHLDCLFEKSLVRISEGRMFWFHLQPRLQNFCHKRLSESPCLSVLMEQTRFPLDRVSRHYIPGILN